MDTPKRLGCVQPSDNNPVTLYTVPAGTVTCIKGIRACNTTETGCTIQICLVSSGDSTSAQNAIYWNFEIPANQTLSDDGSHVLQEGGMIVVQAETESAVTFTASGMEET